MSNPVRYDPFLVRRLARELDGVLRGRACDPVPGYGSDLGVVLALDRGEALRIDLHPARGWIRLVPWPDEGEALDGAVLGVESPADERILRIRLRGGSRFSTAEQTLVVELHTNQWNALVVNEADARIVSALRARRAGGRLLAPGQAYVPPPAPRRLGGEPVPGEEAWGRWQALLASCPRGELARAILRHFAWTGTASATALAELIAAGPASGLRDAFEAWRRMCTLERASPVLLSTEAGLLPYPLPLPGVPSRPIPSLLAGMDRVARAPDAAEEAPRAASVLPLAERRRELARRRLESLRAELAQTGRAARLRQAADLLLSRLHAVPRGATRVTLAGWEGEPVELALDPALTPAENAAAWYREARRRARAEEVLPGLVREAERELERWTRACAEAAEGEAPGWVEAELTRGRPRQRAGGEAPSLPYRTYRTSGGLEVRVGRSARDNDRLTFAHAAPDDVWLHARSVSGSHVVLRWRDASGAPPARDLEEAAGLAALHSKAHTSALVPVDWTRRKHVRKPRGAPPGSVVVQRARTLFVAPDAELAERLRAR